MTISGWLQASRLPSQSYIFFPLLLGQGLSVSQGFLFEWSFFILTHLYGLFIQLFIVYANDVADIEVDRLNFTFNMFSGGSRTLVKGIIAIRQMQVAIIITMLSNAGIGLWLLIGFQRPWFLLLLVISWLCLWIYSYPPIKLSYRGGGELIQMLGVGLVLPLIGYYNQSGVILSFPWMIMLFILPIQLAAAMTTSIPDEPSDRQGEKYTSSVLLGGVRVKVIILSLYGLSFSVFLINSFFQWPMSLKFRIIILPLIFVLSAVVYVKNSPAGSFRSNRFVAFMVAGVVFFMAGLSLGVFLNPEHYLTLHTQVN